jgi:DNA-binding protein H-NS
MSTYKELRAKMAA